MTVPVPDQLEFISDGNGVTKEFSYPRRFLQKDEIVVAFRKDNVDLIKGLNIDYTIAGSSWPNGGTVVFSVAPPIGVKVVRYRMTQAKQTVDLENKQRNDANAVEVQLDRLAMGLQDRGRATESVAGGLKAEIAARKAGDEALGIRIDNLLSDVDLIADRAENEANRAEDEANRSDAGAGRSESAALESENHAQISHALVEAAVAGFQGFTEGMAYDFGWVNDPMTYFNRDWGTI